MRSRLLTRVAAAAAAVTALATVTACSDDGPAATTDHPVVVASTDVWASVARAVGGDHAEVIALYNSPDGDPHEFEPSLADTAKIKDGNVLVFNGGHYDAYFETAAADAEGHSVNASAVHEGKDPDTHEEHDHEGDDHDGEAGHHHHADGENEHVFYDLPTVAEVSEKIADALAEVNPGEADYYRTNADDFVAGIDGLNQRLAAIKKAHDGTEVAATEPLATYLLEQAGLKDIAPAAFTAAIENGQSPSAADMAAFTDLLTDHRAKALIYNTQTVDPATESVLGTARRAGVPVVELTESLPAGVTDYLVWQGDQITQLEQALG
ncbi:metal ABC transporter solute-binding protein, Zn/Mn family [Gordonia sp. VNK21]|uniref:metal ABC transporter solute-binding protein, Zn/Mn family n=1 Tax=Gordonia sp. VNK21 TaxID=3382483 RepID=UPI0038D48DCD